MDGRLVENKLLPGCRGYASCGCRSWTHDEEHNRLFVIMKNNEKIVCLLYKLFKLFFNIAKVFEVNLLGFFLIKKQK